MKFLSVLLIGGLIAFATYQIVSLIKIIKERKKAKSENKGEDVNGRNSNCS